MSRLLAVLLVLVAGCGSTATFATLVELSQSGVTVNGQAARAGQALQPADEVVVTGAGAWARLVLPDGVRVYLRPDAAGGETRFNLGRHEEQGSARGLFLKLIRGVVMLVVPARKAGDALEVQASWTTTAVKGTEFKVTSSEAGDTVAVKEGVVEVRANAGDPPPVKVEAAAQVSFDSSKKLFAKSEYAGMLDDAKDGYAKPGTLQINSISR